MQSSALRNAAGEPERGARAQSPTIIPKGSSTKARWDTLTCSGMQRRADNEWTGPAGRVGAVAGLVVHEPVAPHEVEAGAQAVRGLEVLVVAPRVEIESKS